MTVADVTSRIQSIQSQIAMLAQSGTSAAAFASALGGATSSTPGTASLDASSFTTGAGAATGTAGSTGVTGDQVVAEASQYVGTPYVWGGTDPEKGLDCSGLVQLAYRNLGIDLPRVSRDQAQEGTPVASLAEAQPGDLLAFGNPVHHIAIYAGNGKMVEAPRPGLDVRISDVWETPSAIRRVIGSTTAATSAVGASPYGAGSYGTGSVGTGSVSTGSMSGVGSTALAANPVGSAGDVPFSDLFDQAASTYGMDPKLLAAVAKQESGFDPTAVSPAGARGLMQLMPATAKGLGVEDSFNPAQSIDGAARMLSDLTGRFGSTQLALAAYNAGPGAVLRYNGVPPYPETQNYVRSIMAMVSQS